MNHWIKRGLQGAVVAGGFWLLGAGIASADTTQDARTLVADVVPISAAAQPALPILDTAPVSLEDTQANAPVTAPVAVCGNGVGVLATTAAGCPSSSNAGGTGGAGSTGATDANAPVSAPISITGNTVGIGRPLTAGTSPATAPSGSPAGTSNAAATDGGELANAPVNAPVIACGNSVGILAEPAASCAGSGTGGSTAGNGTGTGTGTDSGPGSDPATANAPVTAPATVCGNSVGAAGSASAGCPSGSGATGPVGQTRTTGGNVPITAPVTVCGNGIGLLGGGGTASCGATAPAGGMVTTPNDPVNPITPITSIGTRNAGGVVGPLAAGMSSSLASTGEDVRAVLAIALGLLHLGLTLGMATRRKVTR